MRHEVGQAAWAQEAEVEVDEKQYVDQGKGTMVEVGRDTQR